MTTRVTVTSNFKQIANQFGAVSQELEQRYPIYVRQCAANICHELLKRTYPVVNNDPSSKTGGTSDAIHQGEDNIRKDVNAMFGSLDNLPIGLVVMSGRTDLLANVNNQIEWRSPVLAKAWESKDFERLYQAFKKAGWEEGEVEVAPIPTVQLQAKMRDPKTGALKQSIKDNPMKRVYVQNKNDIEAFIQERMKSVGKMAGGWVQCLKLLGRQPVNDMNGNGSGSVEAEGTGGDYTVTATNDFGDFNGMLSKTDLQDEVMQEQGLRFRNSVQAMIESVFKAKGKGTDRGDTTTSEASVNHSD